MARVESLGLHFPVALSYLVREGILPKNPGKSLYQWELYVSRHGDIELEEEVLATKNCVVWSQGQHIRNVYIFDVDGEAVSQAILTDFSQTPSKAALCGLRKDRAVSSHARAVATAPALGQHDHPKLEETSHDTHYASTSRALVVFLKSKVHIHYLRGASHIIDLPFEVDRALPTVKGCLIQTKRTKPSSAPSTPQIPSAPPNSFFASQLQAGPSYLQSPTLAKSFASARPTQPSPLSGSRGLDHLYTALLGHVPAEDEVEAPSLYTLTSPLSDFGLVSHAHRQSKGRPSNRHGTGVFRDFETLHAAERIVYASPPVGAVDEERIDAIPFMLLVTANDDTDLVTLWHAWYIEGHTLRDLLRRRSAHKAAKARRRSSFMSSIGTGATTPAARPREHARESMLAGGATRMPTEAGAALPTTASTRRPTKQEEEAAMASQMDPDFQPTTSQQIGRDVRRVSSLNPDIRASQTVINASFGTGARRNASFGVPNERKSFGHRKSRGSTPGSMFNRSVGADEDFMDFDDTTTPDHRENIEEVLRHMRATIEAAGVDHVLGSAEDGYKRELVVRRLHSIPISASFVANDCTRPLKVRAIAAKPSSSDGGDTALNVHLHDPRSKELHYIRLVIREKSIWPDDGITGTIAVPVVAGTASLGTCDDIIDVRDNGVNVLLVSDGEVTYSISGDQRQSLPTSAPYRVSHPQDFRNLGSESDVEFGKNRTLSPTLISRQLVHNGANGSFDETSDDGLFHRRSVLLRPTNEYINTLLEVCETVLPPAKADNVRSLWCTAYASMLQHPASGSGTASSLEMIAFAASVFVHAVSLLDTKAKAAIKVAELAAGKPVTSGGTASVTQKQAQEARLFSRSAWTWMADEAQYYASPETAANERKDLLLYIAMNLAMELSSSIPAKSVNLRAETTAVIQLMHALHIYHEECRLNCLARANDTARSLAPIILQLGTLLGLPAWSYTGTSMYTLEISGPDFAFVRSTPIRGAQVHILEEPMSVYQWFEHCMQNCSSENYPSLALIAARVTSTALAPRFVAKTEALTPRITLLLSMNGATSGFTASPATTVRLMAELSVSTTIMETLPDAIAAPFKEAIARCERAPPTDWSPSLLQLVGREDLMLATRDRSLATFAHSQQLAPTKHVHSITHALEQPAHMAKTREAGRHAVSQLIFSEDRRLVEANALMHFHSVQTAECPKQPDWTDQFHLEQQRRVMQWVLVRMIALPVGDGMLHFDSQTPLMTEKFHLPGFSSTCVVQPMGHALTIDRSGLTEEKVNWAYFHAGASAGLRISRQVKGIDTSWIAFNKPSELTNRHAGLLLALGLGGHLRSMAKWLAFKYLTPKHSMTSVGLLLGLSASYIGSMDSLITRMLSVHITRMLPPGATELNVSPITQSAGLMGVGLLYYNTQHRRMTEIMLSEIEYMEVEDPDSGPDQLRDESYRLAAGFALGFINLGKGHNLGGLHGMDLPERLLAIAVGSRPLHAVHVFDRATAGAIVAVALIYMKSGNSSIARKIDIPDTQAQFDHVRPDMLLLRAMAKHIILWDGIEVQRGGGTPDKPTWIESALPDCYKGKVAAMSKAKGKHALMTSEVPFYNIITGLAWALGMKYAGTGDDKARDDILSILDCFYTIRGGSDMFYYDAKLARSTLRRCIDVLALSAATIMAGTGDIKTLRYLRRMHGRVDPDTTYGSHMAAHLAVGALFLVGGTSTFGTSNLAIASLMCAFYPLFPTDVHDNRVHLQAFRHLWVFAAEARCLVIEDSDTSRPLTMPISVVMKDGSARSMAAPCLLPDLDKISTIHAQDPAYWLVTLDFAGNPAHLAAFRRNQRIQVRKCPASEAHDSVFSATLAAASKMSPTDEVTTLWQSVFDLPAFRKLASSDLELILPTDAHSSTSLDDRGTVVETKLALARAVSSDRADELWNLRLLFAWADMASREGEGKMKWIGKAMIEALRTKIEQRSRSGQK